MIQLPVSIGITFFSLPAFKQKTIFLAALKAVDAIFTFTTRAVFTGFKPLHSQTSLHIITNNKAGYPFPFFR